MDRLASAGTFRGPPSFGPDGGWPPVDSDPIVIGGAKFEVQLNRNASDALYVRTVDSYRSKFEGLSGPAKQNAKIVGDLLDPTTAFRRLSRLMDKGVRWALRDASEPSIEMREIVVSQGWRREDPIIQLPPGASHEINVTRTTGVSATQSQELAASTGLKLGGGLSSLSAELSSKFGITTTLDDQLSRSERLSLANDQQSLLRLYARWWLVEELSVFRLNRQNGAAPNQDASESPDLIFSLRFEPTSSVVLTHLDLPI